VIDPDPAHYRALSRIQVCYDLPPDAFLSKEAHLGGRVCICPLVHFPTEFLAKLLRIRMRLSSSFVFPFNWMRKSHAEGCTYRAGTVRESAALDSD
jgi:hypothetical protein